MFIRDRPKNLEKKYTLSHMINIFPRLYKADVFSSKRPYLEIDLQILNNLQTIYFSFFVCLFEVYSPTRECFTHMETSPLPVKGCKFWPRHSWPLGSEGSLTCCDMGLPFIIVISEEPWHAHLLPSVWQWSCHYLFLRLRSIYFLRKLIIK